MIGLQLDIYTCIYPTLSVCLSVSLSRCLSTSVAFGLGIGQICPPVCIKGVTKGTPLNDSIVMRALSLCVCVTVYVCVCVCVR